MSIAELGMLINSNFEVPLNEQIRNNQYQGAYVFSESSNITGTFKPDKPGYYKIIVVGAGGDEKDIKVGDYRYIATGGSGGVAIKTLYLDKTKNYAMEFYDNGKSAKFNGNIIATYGESGYQDDYASVTAGMGGTASGGDFNYPGISGVTSTKNYPNPVDPGASVGVFIPALMQRETRHITKMDSSGDLYTGACTSGYGVLGYGGAAGVVNVYNGWYSSGYGAAAIIIIPLELER